LGDSQAEAFWRAPVAIGPDTEALSPDRVAAFEALADYLPTLCWLAMPDGHIVWYNRRWHDYCGSTPEEMEGWGWQVVHDPGVLPDVMAQWTSSIASGEPFEMVFPLRGADGRYRPFLTRIVPLRGADGAILRWLGVNTEIGAQLRAEAALSDSEASFKVLTDAMPQMVWSTLPDGYHDYYNAQWYEFTGVPAGSTDGEGWSGMFHPEDQERAWDRWRHSLRTGEPYEIQYRLRRHDGVYRWTLGRALPVRNAQGEIVRWIGTCTDIHDEKTAADQAEVLSRELSHRIKNIFAVIAGLVQLSGRSHPEQKSIFADLTERVMALGRAHNFARPHSESSQPEPPSGQLYGLLRELMSPYQSADGRRVVIRCDEIRLDDKGATPLALTIHELATNSAKYGALSCAEGHVTLVASLEGDAVTLVWSEFGGPTIEAEPTEVGFGTRLARLSVEQQLGGTLAREWLPQGLRVTIRVAHSHLHRGQ
jgi:PAS domain S-box-containing protein